MKGCSACMVQICSVKNAEHDNITVLQTVSDRVFRHLDTESVVKAGQSHGGSQHYRLASVIHSMLAEQNN